MKMERWVERVRERFRKPADRDVLHQVREAVHWIYRAQDSSADRGVAHSYVMGAGWTRSYPETTGYIIPTLLNWSRVSGDCEASRRAIEMADWELTVQLENGAVPNVVDGSPTVFDTGQVIFGWLSAHEETRKAVYLEAAVRAGEWLMEVLDEHGVWRNRADAGGPGRVYNARVAWALLELARVSGEARFGASMRRFLSWTLEQEREGGWFDRNCLTDDSAPLLHTIAYTAQGQLESGLLLEFPPLVAAATRTARALATEVGPDGRMPGRFGRGWRAAARWSCLTGMAQISSLWRRLHDLEVETGATDGRGFSAAAERVNAFLRRTQDCTSRNGGLRGGIRGSFPVNGAYGRYRVLNWATKFFIDALMEELPGERPPYRY